MYGVGEFYRNGKLLYTGEIVAGYLGLNTALAHGKFSISLNSRTHPPNSIANLMSGNYLPIAYEIRKALEVQPDFASVVKHFEQLKLPTNAYITIGGLQGNEGIVLTRDENGVFDSIVLSESRWFVIVTNWDRNALEPVYDVRKTIGILRVSAIGE